MVKPGASLSLQLHHHRSEHWIVVQGMARVVNGERELYLRTNESTYIPAGHRHREGRPAPSQTRTRQWYRVPSLSSGPSYATSSAATTAGSAAPTTS